MTTPIVHGVPPLDVDNMTDAEIASPRFQRSIAENLSHLIELVRIDVRDILADIRRDIREELRRLSDRVTHTERRQQIYDLQHEDLRDRVHNIERRLDAHIAEDGKP